MIAPFSKKRKYDGNSRCFKRQNTNFDGAGKLDWHIRTG